MQNLSSTLQMEGSIADELYSETLQLSNGKLDHGLTINISDSNGDELWHKDGSLGDVSDDELEKISDLDREWQRRRDHFHTIGYRDGVIAGKEASSQEGFNIGFKESVLVGYNWGLVKGVTRALTCLPDGLGEKLVETQETRSKIQGLHETVHSISTEDALKLFHDDILKNKSVEPTKNVESSSLVGDLQDQSSDRSILENHFEELQSLLHMSPAVKVHLTIDK